ncbi:MAG: trigger factor [Deltaproteobacteria bacterium]|nr:trigger factor [Deltaproteobacteria bacterium]
MKTSVEEIGPVKRKLTVDLPVERVVASLEEAYAKIQKTAKLKGFRQGKVPRHLLEQYFKQEAETEAAEALVRASFREAATQVQLVPLATPRVETGPFSAAQPFTYSAVVEVRPAVQLGTYTGFKLEHAAYGITDEEVEIQLRSAQQSMTKLCPVDETAGLAEGMVARIDFDGTADGKPFEGSRAVDYVIDVGGGKLLPAFEATIMGMRVGETKQVSFTYPDDYFNVNLAGAKGEFRVTCKELKRKEVPDLTDEFAKDLGNFATLADVRAEIRKRLTVTKERQAKGELAEHAMRQLLASHPFEVPETMVGWELEVMYREIERRAKAQGKTMEALGMKAEQFVAQYEAAAKDRVRGTLLLDAVCETEKIQVTDDEIDARLQEIAQSIGEPAPKVRLTYEQQDLLPALTRQLRHEKALDFIIGTSKIKITKGK